jgi:MtN3 and saliva related transmembrane protein
MHIIVSRVEILGLTAALLTTGSFLPQATKVWRNRDTAAISVGMYIMMAVGNALWIIYAIAIESPSLMLANGFALSFSIAILALKIKHG